ncbi:MAG: hypothetical protein SCK28_13895 [Bacillota bacterium]|nr:hypothetical protein [Bacillota bacterium]
MVAIDNLFGLIIFIVFILLRMMGSKNPPPPRRQERPPAQTQEPTRPAEVKAKPQRREVEDEFFPIPDDLREIFGLPPVEREEKKVLKPKSTTIKEKTQEYNLNAAPKDEKTPEFTELKPSAPIERKAVASTGLGVNISLNKKEVLQGVIWAEILHNPRGRRRGPYSRIGRL